MKLNKLVAITFVFAYQFSLFADSKKKIIGLVPQRNERNIIANCLKALSKFTDAIIVLDDCSTDDSVSIIKSLAKECNVVEIIEKKTWYRDESGDRNLLLETGRKHKGTHFIVLDADEILSGNCLVENRLRNTFLKLNPGDRLAMHWYQLWRSFDKYRNDGVFAPVQSIWLFCDDGKCSYEKSFLHTSRVPPNLSGTVYFLPKNYAIMHFQFVQWENLLIKQAWYRCLEHIRNPEKSISEINALYKPSKDETNLVLENIPDNWFEPYSYIDKSAYLKPEVWRKEQILGWFTQYGKAFFEELDIWDITWFKSESISD